MAIIDSMCETARHHEMPAGCALPDHRKCAVCERCYTCDEMRQRREMYALIDSGKDTLGNARGGDPQ